MADIKTLLEAVRKLSLPAAVMPVEDFATKMREQYLDDREFVAMTKELLKPNAYSADDVKQVYNLVLERNQRFGKSVSKKKLVEQLIAEREIMISNDNAREVIRAHSTKA